MSTAADLSSDTDPFTLEVIKHYLTAVGDEMFVAQQRTSMSPLIYEVLDFATGVTTSRGETVTQGQGVTIFLAALAPAVRHIITKFGADIGSGDLFITNDPFTGGGTHLCDVAIVMPVFYGDERIAFVGNKAHWLDVGGKDPGSQTTDSNEVFQEGLQIPAVKLVSGGEVDQGILELIESNSRLPRVALGDLWAGVAACRVGERRLQQLCSKFGASTVSAAMERLLDEAELRTRAALSELPKGTFTATGAIDDDGRGNGPLPVRVKVTISDEAFECDFEGSVDQVEGPLNCTAAGLEGAARIIYVALSGLAAGEANDGIFRSLIVKCPPGTIFTAERPAPVAMYWEAMLFALDLVWQALAPHLPETLPAGHFLSVCAITISGLDETGDRYVLNEPEVGGWGASSNLDGQRGLFSIGDGETYAVPVEVIENRYPLRVTRFQLHNDQGGAGRHRGGNGVVRELEILGEAATVTAILGRHKFPPWGLAGGQPGSPNRLEIDSVDEDTLTVGKIARHPLGRGSKVRVITGTGGGYGRPGERPVDCIRADVLNGYVTNQQAAEDYGVRFDDETGEARRQEEMNLLAEDTRSVNSTKGMCDGPSSG